MKLIFIQSSFGGELICLQIAKFGHDREQFVDGSIKEDQKVATIYALILEPTGRAEDENKHWDRRDFGREWNVGRLGQKKRHDCLKLTTKPPLDLPRLDALILFLYAHT